MRKKKKILMTIMVVILVIIVLGVIAIKLSGIKFKNKIKDLEYKNNVTVIDIGKIKTFKLDNQQYIMIEVSNNTTENKYSVSLEVQFVNKDKEVIYTTGAVKEVLVAKMNDNICAKISNEISDLVNSSMIDHIVINQL